MGVGLVAAPNSEAEAAVVGEEVVEVVEEAVGAGVEVAVAVVGVAEGQWICN